MNRTTGTVDFKFPYKIHTAHFILEILIILITLTPILLIVLIRMFFPKSIENININMVSSLALFFSFVFIILIFYSRVYQRVPDLLYRKYILRNVKCPKCNSYISSYERTYPKASQFSEYYYNCDLCKSKNLIELPDESKGWNQTWVLSSKKPKKEDFKKYKYILQKSKNLEELQDLLKRFDIDQKDLERYTREQYIKHGVYKDLEYDRKVRRITLFTLAILIIIGFLVYNLIILKYDIEPFTNPGYMIGLISLLFVITIGIIAIFDHILNKKK